MTDKNTIIQFKIEMNSGKYPGLKESDKIKRILEIAWKAISESEIDSSVKRSKANS